MPDVQEITGIQQIDSDLAKLFALMDDADRLEEAKAVVADQKSTMERLQSVLEAPIIQIGVALGDEESANALLEETPETARPLVRKAIEFVKTHLDGIERHPAIIRELKKQAARQSGKKIDEKNTIDRLAWEPVWGAEGGKLMPSARVSFLDQHDELLLDSTLDADSLVFLMRACARILRRLFELSKPISDASLLSLSDTERIPERLSETRLLLDELVELGTQLGIPFDEEREEEKRLAPQLPQE